MTLPKVLIGCPTNQRKDYILSEYLSNVNNFTYPNKYFYFSDNSYDIFYHIDHFILKGYDCGYVYPQNKANNQYICESYNQIRDYFLSSDCDYWLSLEIDLIPPKDIIERLLALNTQVASARYFIGDGGGSHLLCTDFDDSCGENINRNCFTMEGFNEYGTGNTITGCAGLGCMLIHRDIVQSFPFYVVDEVTHNDTFFSRDIDFVGLKIKYDDTIVQHKNSSWYSVSDNKKHRI